MSQAYKCDRCGKLYESEMRTLTSKKHSVLKPHTINYTIGNPGTYLSHVADLCPKCQEQLELWMKGMAIEKPDEEEYKCCRNCKFGDIDNAPICDMCDCAYSNWKPKEQIINELADRLERIENKCHNGEPEEDQND